MMASKPVDSFTGFMVIEQVHQSNAHRDDVNSICVSNVAIASCSGDKTVRVFNWGDFQEKPYSPITLHKYQVICCTFTSDGELLASSSMDGKCSVVEAQTGRVVAVCKHPSEKGLRVCRFSSNDSLLALGAIDGSICLFETSGYSLVKMMVVGDDESIVSLSFTADGSWLISGNSVGDMRIWNAAYPSNVCTRTELAAHDSGVLSSDITARHPVQGYCLLATAGGDGMIKLWSVGEGEAASGKAQGKSTVSPNPKDSGDIAAFSSGNKSPVKLVLKDTLLGHSAPVYSCRFSTPGTLLVSGGGDYNIRIWDVDKGLCLYTQVESHSRFVNCCAFSPDTNFVVSCSSDRSVKVWRLTNTFNLLDASQAELLALGITDDIRRGVDRVESWDVNRVAAWINSLKLEKYSQNFRSHDIDGAELLQLNKEVLENELGIDSYGARNKIIQGLLLLQKSASSAAARASLASDSQYAAEFLCPITHELMKDPVLAADGYSYERKAIEGWINAGKRTSPMTNAELTSLQLIPNRSLKILIAQRVSEGKAP